MEDLYIPVYWPEVQDLMEDPEFLKNAVLINNDEMYDEYGSSAYLVRLSWLKLKTPKNI